MYLDTSVLVKRYTSEPDSDEVDARLIGATLVTSDLALGEVWSALLAKERGRMLTAAQRVAAWAALQEDVAAGALHLIPLDRILIREANAVMLAVHPHVPLRTLDAIHLATYESVTAGPLFTKDSRMLAAAQRLGFPTVE